MREEIAKIISSSIFKNTIWYYVWPQNKEVLLEVSDQILALPVGNSTLGEVLEILPGMVEAASGLLRISDLWVPYVLCEEHRGEGEALQLGHAALKQALTLKSGELLKVER